MQDTIYVDCPCCGARLEARREDGKVLKHWKTSLKKEAAGKDPIKAAQERMAAEAERLKRYLEGAGDILERQKRETMEKFEAEKERIRREGDDSPPPRPFDNE